MTIAVDLGLKATKQTNKYFEITVFLCENIKILSLCMQHCYGRHNITLLNVITSSGLLTPDPMSCDSF